MSLQTIEQVAANLKAAADDVRRFAMEALDMKTVDLLNPEQVQLVETQFRDRQQTKKKPARPERRKISLKSDGGAPKRNTTTVGGREILIEGRKQRPPRRARPAPAARRSKPVSPPPAAAEKAPAPVSEIKIDARIEPQQQELGVVSDLLARQQKRKAQEDAARKRSEESKAAATAAPGADAGSPQPRQQPSKRDEQMAKLAMASKESQERERDKRRRTRGTLTMDRAKLEARSRRESTRRSAMNEVRRQEFQKPVAPQARTVAIGDSIRAGDLAHRLGIKSEQVQAKAEDLGAELGDSDLLDQETAMIIVEELGHVGKAVKSDREPDEIVRLRALDDARLEARAPVVTVMGHVDHGKTSLLDYIRKAKVAEGESGGITQHIGAYAIEHNGSKIVFLDTPGHEVFTEMRARGAKVTDIVILVVAADDGVMPQTIEAIDHARAAAVPLIIAINKIDKPEAKIDRMREQLAGRGLQPEEWGGDVIMVPVSAHTGEGVDKLLEAVQLTAEVLELKAAVDVVARGTVIEAHTTKGVGSVVTGIVAHGQLKKGQMLLCDTAHGRVRGMKNEHGEAIALAGPATPVEIQGLSEMPKVGSEFMVVPNERVARDCAERRRQLARDNRLEGSGIQFAEDADSWLEMSGSEAEKKFLNLIIKADVAGSAEALEAALLKFGNDEVSLKILHCAVGGVTESDVNLAAASGAMICGFRVSTNNKARKMIEERSLKAIFHEVVYEVVDDVKAALEGMLDPEIEEKVIGCAEVRQLFTVSKTGKVAGCAVVDGTMRSDLALRVVRDGKIMITDEISSLRHFKEEVKSIEAGSECGIRLRRFADFKVGDRFESVEVISTAQVL